MSWKIYYQDMKDIVWGAALLGAGGGGSPEQGLKIARDIFEKEGVEYIDVVSPDDVADDAIIVVSAGMGSPEVAKRSWSGENIYALKKMEEVLKINTTHIIPLEIGAGNFAAPLHAAAEMGLPIVDADGAGRAIPELEMVLFNIYGVSISPLAIADAKGNSGILYPIDARMAERLARAITIEMGMSAGIACYLMNGEQMREASIPHTLTLSRDIGRIIQEMKEKNEVSSNIAEEVARITGGYVLFNGEVVEITSETKQGFDVGKVIVSNGEDTFRVDVKNENMMAWKNDKLVAMAPDLICWMGDDGTPLTNADIKRGTEVFILGIPAHEKWRTPRATLVFKHVLEMLGYTGNYVPIEKLVEE